MGLCRVYRLHDSYIICSIIGNRYRILWYTCKTIIHALYIYNIITDLSRYEEASRTWVPVTHLQRLFAYSYVYHHTLCWCSIILYRRVCSLLNKRCLFSRNSDFVFNPDENIKRYAVDLPGSVYAPWKNDFSRTPIQQCSVLHRDCTLAYRHDPRTVFIVPVRYIVIVVRVGTRTRPQRVKHCSCTNIIILSFDVRCRKCIIKAILGLIIHDNNT